MIEKFLKELEDRRSTVEKLDFEIQLKNIDHFRSFWLHMIILSSAIVIGVLPIMNGSSILIKSLILAKFGLLIIVLVCVLATLYFQNVLHREKLLILDQNFFHKNTFSNQENILINLEKVKKSEAEIKQIFDKSKTDSLSQEIQIIKKHLTGGGFPRIRLFVDKYFNKFISFGFALGVFLVILSFIICV